MHNLPLFNLFGSFFPTKKKFFCIFGLRKTFKEKYMSRKKNYILKLCLHTIRIQLGTKCPNQIKWYWFYFLMLPLNKIQINNFLIPKMLVVFETCLKLCKLQCKSDFDRKEILLLMIENFEINQMVRGMYESPLNHLNSFFVPLHQI